MGKPGDWTCPRCGDLCFGSRAACRQCDAARPDVFPTVAWDWTPKAAPGTPPDMMQRGQVATAIARALRQACTQAMTVTSYTSEYHTLAVQIRN